LAISSVVLTAADPKQFVSRAGLKLDHALREFGLDVAGLVCADFGCNVGGFTDCLLQHGAASVYAIDTGYNVLAYKLRVDERVVVMERTNALHIAKPQAADVDLVVIDMAWTPQRYALPAAVKWLVRDDGADVQESGRILTLVKPHYELDDVEKRSLLVDGRLEPAEAERVLHRVLEQMPGLGVTPLHWTKSPITGGKSGKKRKSATGLASGNVEFLVLGSVQSNG
jgi:23S rRNA (cytidine1920-2'-O)/16S rRNA (cytidine1409-2'-O)-methyltransferase